MSEQDPRPIQITESDQGRVRVDNIITLAANNGALKADDDEASEDDTYYVQFPGCEARWYDNDSLRAAILLFNNPGIKFE